MQLRKVLQTELELLLINIAMVADKVRKLILILILILVKVSVFYINDKTHFLRHK